MDKIKLKYDFKPVVRKARLKATNKIVNQIFTERKFFENENWNTLYKVQFEYIKNYSIPIYTVRFDEEVVLRRFPMGLSSDEGVRFKIKDFAPNRLVNGSYIAE